MQFHCIKWDIQLNQEIEYMWKDMDSCLLLEVWVINMERNLLIQLKKSATDVIKTASKRAIQKTAKATGDLVGNKKGKSNNNNNDDVELTTHKKDTYHQEKDNKLLMN